MTDDAYSDVAGELREALAIMIRKEQELKEEQNLLLEENTGLRAVLADCKETLRAGLADEYLAARIEKLLEEPS